VIIRPGKKAPLALDGKLYRGKLELVPQGGFLRVVNIVALESYLQGVVAGEVPFSWPAEVLKAQAVAARSYAIASLLKGKPFDLYPDARSQMYLGVAGEKPSTTKAVADTAGEVVLYAGKVATTYYFSSSGGKTASAADVFGFAVPYLVSRPDPWDKLSPYFRWGPVLLGARTLQSKLDADARVIDARGVGTPSGRLRTLTLQTVGGEDQIPASLVRTALGLRSTWVTIGVLRLDRPTRGAVVFGSSTHLSGIGRGLGAPKLASSLDGSSWSQGVAVSPDAVGAVAYDVTPARTTRYRLEAEGGASPALLVQVAPRITLGRPTQLEPGVLAGTVRPKRAGLAVEIERRKGTAWAPVGGVITDGTGAFRLELDTLVPAGSYRARTAATADLAAGTSATVLVTG
jgi:stage II sporulation protein D